MRINTRLSYYRRLLSKLMSDLRVAARVLLKSPAFSGITVALLALGIGANAIFFSAFDHILLRPLPVGNPKELVRVVQKIPGIGIRGGISPFAYYEALKTNATTLSTVFGAIELTAAIGEPAQQIRLDLVTPNYFETLGVPALYGRTLTPTDDAQPVVLSYRFWTQRFNASPAVLNQTVLLNGHRFIIVGVTSQHFNGVSTETSPDIRASINAYPLFANPGQTLARSSLELAARLKPGVTVSRAQAECLSIWRFSVTEFFKTLPYYKLHPASINEEINLGMQLDSLEHGISALRTRFGVALQFLAASAALLQLIVCANLAGLLLARNASRARDTAVRLAIGATRRRLIKQMLAESFLLTAAGAAGGIILAYTCAPLLVRALPPVRDAATTALTVSLDLRPDLRVLAFSLTIGAVTIILTGLGPAISASHVSLDLLLRGARSSNSWRGRQLLLVLQIALCTVLLAGAGLLIRTFERLNNTNPGFDRDHLAAFTTVPSLSGYKPDQIVALRLGLLSRVRQIPGVIGAAVSNRPLLRGSGLKSTVAPAGQRILPADAMNTSMTSVSPGYFETMGMTILSGRTFLSSDTPKNAVSRVVVNEAFVRHFYPGINPIGKAFGGGPSNVGQPNNEIIGVVSDAKYRSMREPMTPRFFYLSTGGDFTLYVRTRVHPEELIQPVRQALAALDPALPFTEVHTLSEEIAASTAPERLTSALASTFSLTAAILASIGIYGLVAFAVAQRKREIGIRMAVGARPTDIAEMFGLQAMLTAAASIALGTVTALLIAPIAASLLYDVSPLDTKSFVFAATFMAIAAAMATAIPATRAALIRPAEALRQD